MPPNHGHEGHGGEPSLGQNTVLQVWAAVFAAVCLSVLLELGKRSSLRRLRASGLNCKRAGTHAQGIGSKLWIKIRYALSYPVPPRSMWAWGAGGAVSVLDVLVMGAWAAMAYTCLYYKVQARLNPAASPDKQMKVYAKAIGTATRAQLALALLPIPRSNFLAWLIPEAEFSALIKYHRWMSWGLLYTYCLHGAAYSYVWLGGAGILVALTNTVNLLGLIALLLGLIVSLSSCSWMRRSNYQWFYKIHVIGAPLFLLALFIHDRLSALYVVPAMLLVVVDRVHRIWADLVNRTSLSVAQGSLAVEGGIITIKLPWTKNTLLHGTETLYLTIPALSSNPHPFSVADVVPQTHSDVEGHNVLGQKPDPGQIATIHAKVSGGWTSGLRRHAMLKPNEPLLVKVEGPYESSLRALPHSPVIVMVAGGIGITPLLALLRRWNQEHVQAAAKAEQAPCASPPRTGPAKLHPCTSSNYQLTHPQGKSQQQQQQALAQSSACLLSSQGGTSAEFASDAQQGVDAQQSGRAAEFASDAQQGVVVQHGLGCRKTWDVESLCCGENEKGYVPQFNASILTDSADGEEYSSDSSSRSNSSCGSGGGDTAGLPTSTAPPSPILSSGKHASGTRPSQVYLVFSCKSLDELRLLGPELLDAAYGSGTDKWLHLYVSYTGFEMEAAGKTCATCTKEGQECILRPSVLSPQPPSASKPGNPALEGTEVCKCDACPRASHTRGSLCSSCRCTADLSGFRCAGLIESRGTPGGADQGADGCRHSMATASNQQLGRSLGAVGAAGSAGLQPPPSRHLFLYFACACLAFAGAYMSLMHLVPSLLEYLAGGDWYGPVESGIVLFVLAVSGAAIPPVLLLFIHHKLGRLCRWLRGPPCKPNQREQEPQLLQCCVHSNDADDQRITKPTAGDGTHSTGLRVLPRYELDWDTKRQGKRINVCRGRPQLTQLLRAVQQLHGNASRACSGLSSSGGNDDNSSNEPLIQSALDPASGVGDNSSSNEPLVQPVPRCDLIPVLIGGPEPMWVSTQEACWQLNGLRAPAFLEPHRVAHQH